MQGPLRPDSGQLRGSRVGYRLRRRFRLLGLVGTALVVGCDDGRRATCLGGIELEPGPTLSDPEGTAGLSRPLAMARMQDGRFLVVPSVQQGTILVFREDGVFDRTLGQPGEGPGEYEVVRAIEASGGGVIVLDSGGGRITELDEVLGLVRVVSLSTAAGQMGLLRDGVVLVGPARRGGVWRDRVSVLTTEGTEGGTFFHPTAQMGNREAPLRVRVASDMNGSVALGSVEERLVHVWTALGDSLAAWSAATSEAQGVPGLPPARLEILRFDGQGRLWTVTDVPDARWAAVASGSGRRRGGPVLREGVLDKAWDSVIQLWDSRTGEVLAAGRVDPSLLFLLGDGFAASYREDEQGFPFVEVWRLRVDRACRS